MKRFRVDHPVPPPRRVFRISRGSADRDPMFDAMWYGTGDSLSQNLNGAVDGMDPVAIVLQPRPADADQWEAALGAAAEVNEALRGVDVDSAVLMTVVVELVYGSKRPSAADIVAAYRKRAQELRHD